ncbi:MAG: SDR family NAD(P)-dependent oxidoreductase [Geminicoccaceae bacterium]
MSDPVLIFGATGGIGGSIASHLVSSGGKCFLSGRDDQRLAAFAGELDMPHKAGDVLDEEALASVVEAAGDRLAGLVFAVGSIDLAPASRATTDMFLTSFQLNALSAAQAVRLALPALKKGKGSIVLFSSVAASRGFPNHSVIATAKAAVEGLSRSLAAELAPHIRVNCVAPTLTETDLASDILRSDVVTKALAEQHPLRRLGQADDVAKTAVWLLGDGAAYVTGQVIAVDGGRSTLRGKD